MSVNGGIEILDSILSENDDELAVSSSPIVVLKDGEIDPRFLRMSYSSGLLFNGCERKFQIQKLQGKHRTDYRHWQSELTFSFGHAIGEAVQDLLAGKTKDQVIFNMFCKWKEDLFAENEKQKKTFFHALNGVLQFISMREDGFLEEYELVYYDNKPAAELSFKINFPNGFKERGYVDIVLRNKITGLFAIFEIKTDSGVYLQPAKYRNSSQATGYSVVLDKIEPGQTDYTVYYLVFMSRQEKWECFEFPKTNVMRALWVEDRVEDFSRIAGLVAQRGNDGVWPMRGNHCVAYMRECEYLGTCHMKTERLITNVNPREDDFDEDVKYDFDIDFLELIG